MNKIKQVFSNDSDKNVSHSTGTTGAVGDSHNTGLGHNTGTSHNTGLTGNNVSSGAQQAESHSGSLLQHAAPPAHSHPHGKDHTHLNQDDASHATHDHKHVAAVTHEKHHEHEVEEVQRQTEIDKHVHHVQHHVQPVRDTQHAEVQHHDQVHPVSRIEEKHVNTDEDRALYSGLNKHKDEFQHAGKERTIVDKGETVHENTSHHVHHVVQPVIERDTHEHHVVHTVIPTHHTSHEAPIIHQSVEHEPMHMKDFVAGGGDLKSKLTHENAGVLSNGECERSVDGPLESLKEKLHLGSTSSNKVTPTGASAGAGENTRSAI